MAHVIPSFFHSRHKVQVMTDETAALAREGEIPNALANAIRRAGNSKSSLLSVEEMKNNDKFVGNISDFSARLASYLQGTQARLRQETKRLLSIRQRPAIERCVNLIDDLVMDHRLMATFLLAQLHAELPTWKGSHLLTVRRGSEPGSFIAVLSERTVKHHKLRVANIALAIERVHDENLLPEQAERDLYDLLVTSERELLANALKGKPGGPLI